MRGTRDARVVVTNRLLALAGEALVVEVKPGLHELAEIMLDRGLTTWAETADPSRSDCHAWGASPNYELFRTVLGLDSAAPGFARVIVRPFLGKLTHVSGSIPHPKGEIAVTLSLDNGKLEAGVTLPSGVEGRFEWHGQTRALHSGENRLTL